MRQRVLLASVCLILVLSCAATFAQPGDGGPPFPPPGGPGGPGMGGPGMPGMPGMGMPGMMPGMGMPGMMMMGGPQPTPVMLLDAANQKLFVLIGDRLFMYGTADLKLLAETRLPMSQPGMMGMGGGQRPPMPGGPGGGAPAPAPPPH